MRLNSPKINKKRFFLLVLLFIILTFCLKAYLSHKTPEIVWKINSGNIIRNLHANNKTLYYGTLDSYYYAIDGLSGIAKWKYKLNHQEIILKQPIISNGTIYIISDKGNIYSLNAQTGQLVEGMDISQEDFTKAGLEIQNQTSGWSARNSEYKRSALFEFEGLLFHEEENYLHALNKDTGKEIWKIKSGRIPFPPVASNNTLYYVRENYIFPGDSSWYSLHAVDIKTGLTKWRWDKSVVSEPIESGGILYVIDNDNLSAIK